MDKELQNLLDNYEQAIYGYTEPIIPSIHQIHLLLDYVSQLDIKVKKQKEVIDKATELINRMDKECEEEGCSFVNLIEVIKIKDILKEVSE